MAPGSTPPWPASIATRILSLARRCGRVSSGLCRCHGLGRFRKKSSPGRRLQIEHDAGALVAFGRKREGGRDGIGLRCIDHDAGGAGAEQPEPKSLDGFRPPVFRMCTGGKADFRQIDDHPVGVRQTENLEIERVGNIHDEPDLVRVLADTNSFNRPVDGHGGWNGAKHAKQDKQKCRYPFFQCLHRSRPLMRPCHNPDHF